MKKLVKKAHKNSRSLDWTIRVEKEKSIHEKADEYWLWNSPRRRSRGGHGEYRKKGKDVEGGLFDSSISLETDSFPNPALSAS